MPDYHCYIGKSAVHPLLYYISSGQSAGYEFDLFGMSQDEAETSQIVSNNR